REGVAIGAILIRRMEVKPFSEKQIKLLETFADQAVIAVENVRLFTELQARNSELRVALEQQTATSEILRVISGSPTDVQPVFDAIVQSATRLCGAAFAAAFRYDGQQMTFTAHNNMTDAELPIMRPHFPQPATRGIATGRAMLDRRIVHIPDIREDPGYTSSLRQTLGFRTVLAVPMLRDGEPIGALGLWRREVKPFADKEVELVATFADQAVIAIENVRLFNEAKEALEQQTATSEILRVIASSPTDVQPVFDAIVANAARLCDADFTMVTRFDGGLLHLVAVNNMSAAETAAYHIVFPRPPGRHFVVGRAFVEARPVHVEDIETDPDYDPRTREIIGRAARYRTFLGVPILRDGVSIGAIGCGRHEMKPFTATQIELVKTFADQAVIVIENVRLFKEL